METLHVNVIAKARHAQLHGRDYLVAPLTLIVPGVLPGSQGPLLYTAEEIARNVATWNGVPLVLSHPTVDGVHVSARSPEILEKFGLGTVYNAHIGDGGKLQADGWFDVARLRQMDRRLLLSLERGKPIELSTGLNLDPVAAPPGAVYNGESYSHIATNYRGDHLAVLLDSKGACALEDGCGVLVNEERKSIWRKLGELLGVINADLPTPTEEQKRLGADCAKQKSMGHNPPSWAVDEALWEKAKEAAAKSGHEEDWPYVVAIYEQMGGKIEGAPTANMGPNEPSHDDLREQLESLIKERFGGLMKAGMPGMSMMGGGMMGGEEEHDCIEAVYDKEVVFEMGDKYWSISYTTDLRTGAVTLDGGPPTEVNRVTTYKPVTNATVTKTVDGEELPASAFAYVPDPSSPSTWKLRIDDAQHVGGSIAAIGKGYRGQKVEIPAGDLRAVKKKILAAWKKLHPDAKDADIPEVLNAMDMQQCMDDCEGDRNCIDDCKEMMMNENERKAIIDHLATNCDCWKGDKEGLAKLSDQRLAALKQHSDSQTANTIPQSFEDGDRVFTFNASTKSWEGKAKEKPVVSDSATRLTAEEQELVAFARAEHARQRQVMVDKLVDHFVGNSGGDTQRQVAAKAYHAMKDEILKPLYAGLPPTPVQQPYYPSYLGAAGGGLATNAKDDSNNILPEISINFEEMASPKLRRKQA